MPSGAQREASRARRIEKIAQQRELRPAPRVGAFVLVEACRRAMQGADGARRELDDEAFGHLPASYRGYLQPRRGEPLAEDGSRTLVCLLSDLVGALREVADQDTFTRTARSTHDEDQRQPKAQHKKRAREDAAAQRLAERRALFLFLGVNGYPCSAEAAIRLAHEAAGNQRSRNSGPARHGATLDQAFVTWFDEYNIRPRRARPGPIPRHVGLAGFEQTLGWLERPRSRFYEADRLLKAWGRYLPRDARRMVLLLSTLQAAGARLQRAKGNPLGVWFAQHRHEPALRPRAACALCPSAPEDEQHCPCALRCRTLAGEGGSGKSRRSPDKVRAGQAAVEIAAWTLTHTHARDWHSKVELTWVLTRYPSLSAKHPPLERMPRALAALGTALHAETVAEEKDLNDVATLLDETSRHDLLEPYAQIGLAVLARGVPPEEPQLESLALLGRSLAGAFRELRSERLGDVQRELIAGPAGTDLKALEALQEVPMAEQRLRRWPFAVIAYELALRRVRNNLEPWQAKRWEIEEQLHLGRLGGLVLEAEWLLFQKRQSDATRAHARLLLTQALELSGDAGPLQIALHKLPDLHGKYATDSGAYGAAPAREQVAGVLRYNPRWTIMPKIMRARAQIALAATYPPNQRADREQALARGRELLDELGVRHDLTDRHLWETLRIALVAAAIEGDVPLVSALVEQVVRAGGDDQGDYAAPAAAWRAGTRDVATAAARELRLASERLRAAPILTPRLPDLAVVRGTP
jgi:hypothetical protein